MRKHALGSLDVSGQKSAEVDERTGVQATMYQDCAIFIMNTGAQALKLPNGTRVEHAGDEWLVTLPDGSSSAHKYRDDAIAQAEILGGHRHNSHCACRHWTRAD